MQAKKRPAVYLRVSTRDQEKRETILAQEMALREHFKEIGLDPDKDVLWYRDDGVSGGTSFYNRGGGGELLEDAQSGFIDYVAVFSISRLSRNEDYDFFEFAGKMHRLGISIKAISQGIDTAQRGGKFMAGLFALMAAEERENMTAASRAGSLAGARRGEWQGKASYGYRLGEGGKLEVVEEEAAVVRRIYEMYVSGMGYKTIARHMRETEGRGGGEIRR